MKEVKKIFIQRELVNKNSVETITGAKIKKRSELLVTVILIHFTCK